MDVQVKFPPSFARYHFDACDERTNGIERVLAVVFVGVQRLLQLGDPAAVNLNRGRMQFHDIAGIQDCGQIGGKALLLRLHLDQPGLHACRCSTIGYGIDDVQDLPIENA
ncbi:hypothetical protein [Aurantimonas sp. A3-2-R12]|uniref:hypothetical protein n=1 Tax=Aurantimonas sp. A3-2-R12 TaxID=3114362 RepID=UPI002E196E58|nr:hypothetical protein [Aurantimonas sp. A3-2-R12]